MASLDSRLTISNLLKKGFVRISKKGSDHIRLEFWHQDKLTRAGTKVSHNAQDIDDYLVSLRSKQVCSSKKRIFGISEMSKETRSICIHSN